MYFTGPQVDKVINEGTIKGDVYLGAGDDTFNNSDGKVNGTLNGQLGNDKFVLGSKAETIVFDTTLNALTNVDRIKKFESGKDGFHLDKTVFGSLTAGALLPASQFHKGASAADADDYIIYNKSTGALYYDPDGNGGAPQVKFAQLDPHANLHASDFLVIA